MLSTLEVAQAQRRLEQSIADLDDEAMRVPSHCDGWSRGHVLSHVARNADGMVNLVDWGLSGEVTPMYEPPEARDGDIIAGSSRPAEEIRADITASNERVLAAFWRLEAAVAIDDRVAERTVRLGGDPVNGPEVLVGELPFLRVQEVVLHHHDLLHDLTVDDWPAGWVEMALPRAVEKMAARVADLPTLVVDGDDGGQVVHDGSGVTVTGTPGHLVSWLTGRARGSDLDVLEVSGGQLPTLPDW